jgi:hypothetical protein
MYEGWRLPNEEDWNVLETYVKDDKVRSSNSYKSGADKLKKSRVLINSLVMFIKAAILTRLVSGVYTGLRVYTILMKHR